MASTSESSEVWGKVTYHLPSSSGIQRSDDVKGVRYVIGRAKGCDLQISLKMISGHHCYLIKEDDGKVYLYDTSTNGTYVNDKRVVNGCSEEVRDGDKLYLIRKKTAPGHDFYVVFRAVRNEETDNGCGPSGSVPCAKRIKMESLVKTELVETEDAEFNEAVPAELNSVSSMSNTTENRGVKEEGAENQSEEVEQESSSVIVKDEKETDKEVSSTTNDSMEELLKCSLCLEIFYDPVCLQPCMHCYCSGCYSDWMTTSNKCPQCRGKVKLVAKHHMINSLIDAYLERHPEKRRTDSEVADLEYRNRITKNQLSNLSESEHVYCCPCSQCNNTNDSSSAASSDDESPAPICPQCPGNVKALPTSSGSNASSQPGSSGTSASSQFVCTPSQIHLNCSCCTKPMPDRKKDPTAKPQACELCGKISCHMYFGCTRFGCLGCLNKFSALRYPDASMLKLINDNVVETRILADFAEAKKKNIQNIIDECLSHLDAATYKLPVNINSNSVLCMSCGLDNLRSLLYMYRKDIPDCELPSSVTSRTNCYWGTACRTQKHNYNHSQRYNHICNQTRF